MNFQFSNKTINMKPSIIREILKQMSDPSLISFAGGNPAENSFPVSDIAKYSAEILQNNPVSALQYSITEGVSSVRESMISYVNGKYKVYKQEDNLVILTGSQQALDFSARILCNEGDIIAAEEPAFLGAYNAFYSAGAVIKGVKMLADGVDLNSLESVLSAPNKPKLFYCIPNFQNPTGFTTSLEKRKAIYELCKQYNVPILEDDPYGQLRCEGEDIPPIKSFDEDGLVIYFTSFSKILSPAMRIACCVADKQFINKLVQVKQTSDVHTNVWAQLVCEKIITSENFAAHITKLRSIYRDKLNLMADTLKAECPSIVFTKPQGGMFIWAKIDGEKDAKPFVEKCLKQKLALIPGVVFMVNNEVPCAEFRLNYSFPSEENIVKGIEIMKNNL